MKETLIINGGEPMCGCPKNWDEAKIIEDKLNEKNEVYDPQWKFDCGFKLDFDGRLVSISSRFYPPKSHYGMTWDGTVSIEIGNVLIKEQKFYCKTLIELQIEVEGFVNEFKVKMQNLLLSL